MDKLDRIQKLHRIFKSRRLPVSKRILAEELECSERNVQRLIDNLRIIDAPLEYDQTQKGWRYAEVPDNLFELPGLWLTSDELQSLSLLIQLLESLGNGLLNDEINIIEKEVSKLLKARNINPNAFANHIKILPMNHRQLVGKTFNKISEALLKKRQIHIHYTSFNVTKTQRNISPQVLIHYRENWYIDAWCHLRNELRTFSIARITSAEILKRPIKSISKTVLQQHFTKSYGIFSGQVRHTAKLRFTKQIAREIALQQWHSEQSSEWDGHEYLLTIPYSDDRELIQDLLRLTPHVYVESPLKLRKALQNKLQQGLELQLGKGLGWL